MYRNRSRLRTTHAQMNLTGRSSETFEVYRRVPLCKQKTLQYQISVVVIVP